MSCEAASRFKKKMPFEKPPHKSPGGVISFHHDDPYMADGRLQLWLAGFNGHIRGRPIVLWLVQARWFIGQLQNRVKCEHGKHRCFRCQEN